MILFLDNIKGSQSIALYLYHGLGLETLLKHADQAIGCVCIFQLGKREDCNISSIRPKHML